MVGHRELGSLHDLTTAAAMADGTDLGGGRGGGT